MSSLNLTVMTLFLLRLQLTNRMRAYSAAIPLI